MFLVFGGRNKAVMQPQVHLLYNKNKYMITKEVAAKIYNAYSQIEESKKMLAELNENIKKNDGAINLINSWGEPKGFELHLPTSMSGSRVFGIGVTMGLKVLEKHIEDNERKLTELMTIAAIQLKG